VQAARDGTLFLEEITALPRVAQARLQPVLDQQQVLPVGAMHSVSVDVRVLAGTRQPLSTAVQEERFRPDLQALLDRTVFRIPPLRERRADIPSLFLHLLAQQGLTVPELSPRLVEALCVYDWPLNVRELDHLAQQLATLRPDEPLFRRSHLPDPIRWFSGERDGKSAPAPDATTSSTTSRPVAGRSADSRVPGLRGA
jgi:two-component system, NtrC family, C4-dicarboxylate transport response regulator DctD